MEVGGRFEDGHWSWQRRPLPRNRADQPCAERCRAADRAIDATARQHQALLVTEDQVLAAEAARDGYRPGAVSASELRQILYSDRV